jgi:hypothetical protein
LNCSADSGRGKAQNTELVGEEDFAPAYQKAADLFDRLIKSTDFADFSPFGLRT